MQLVRGSAIYGVAGPKRFHKTSPDAKKIHAKPETKAEFATFQDRTAVEEEP